MAIVELVCGDILSMQADAIVCPAHKHLIKGRGLSKQIYQRAGERLVQECSQEEECGVGEARLTHAYDLPCRYIIHTVTPQWSSGDQWGAMALRELRQCYQSVLDLARAQGIRNVILPALGAGTNRFPHFMAAHVGLGAIKSYLDHFDRLAFCLHTESYRREWLEVAKKYYPDMPLSS